MDGRGSIKELFPTGKQLEPLVAPLADGKVAVGQDDLTVVLNEEGVCTQKCALNWTDIPIAMGKNLCPPTNATKTFLSFAVCEQKTNRRGRKTLYLLMTLHVLTCV